MAGTNNRVWTTTRPLGSMTALSPEMAAWTIQRAFSTARTWLMMTCSFDATESWNEESFVPRTTMLAPRSTNVRNRLGTVFSKQIGAAIFSPLTSNITNRRPGRKSRGTARSCSTHPRSRRNGTYSPKGTRWILV